MKDLAFNHLPIVPLDLLAIAQRKYDWYHDISMIDEKAFYENYLSCLVFLSSPAAHKRTIP